MKKSNLTKETPLAKIKGYNTNIVIENKQIDIPLMDITFLKNAKVIFI